MNQELIDMAKQAGFFVKDNEAYSPSVQEDHELTPFLEAFAVLVAEYSYKKGSVEASVDFEAIILPAALAKVAAAEREACAKLCDYVYDNIVTDEHIKDMAFKIRARGETK